MIIWNGTEWTAPPYRAAQMTYFYTDSQDGYGDDVTFTDNMLTEEQQDRLDLIRYAPMAEADARHFILTGEGTIPDTRDQTDKLIDKLLELDPNGVTTGDLILDSAREWHAGDPYDRYSYVKFDGVLYKTIHPIRVHDIENPPDEPHLYIRVGAIEGGEIAVEEWIQPTGEHDAYKIGDKVLHNGKTWVCTLGDASGHNSWEPGVYGWETVAT